MPTPLRILIAPCCFKESLSAENVCDAIAQGIRRVAPDAALDCVPLADGGEGFTKTLTAATGGTVMPVNVSGPVGVPVESLVGFLGGQEADTAVIEVAAAAGLRLVPPDARNPLVTTSYGVGELIAKALDLGANRLLIGCGDSGTTDGGIGLAYALGVRFLDTHGRHLPLRVDALAKLARIDMQGLDPRLSTVTIDVACNLNSILVGPTGTARVFGPQKGATPQAIEKLEAGLQRLADVILDQFGIDVGTMPGSGAAGGMGTGLHVFLGAHLLWRYDVVFQYLHLDNLLDAADLVFTGEGGINFQTPRGKVPTEVARRAKQRNLPVVAIVGMVGQGARENFDHGIDAYLSIVQEPCSLEHAIDNASQLVADCAETAMRLVHVGGRLQVE